MDAEPKEDPVALISSLGNTSIPMLEYMVIAAEQIDKANWSIAIEALIHSEKLLDKMKADVQSLRTCLSIR